MRACALSLSLVCAMIFRGYGIGGCCLDTEDFLLGGSCPTDQPILNEHNEYLFSEPCTFDFVDAMNL